MADRYQDRPFPADDYDRGEDPYAAGRTEADPLAELARLIGQSDPFGAAARPSPPAPPVPPRAAPRAPYAPYVPPRAQPEDDFPSAGRPSWMQRANARSEPQETSPDVYQEAEDDYEPTPSVHPLHRYAAQSPLPEPDYRQEPQHYQQDAQDYGQEPDYAEPAHAADPSRYDDALFGQIEAAAQDLQRDPAYPNDPYAYQEDYDEEPEEDAPRRRGGLMTVAAVLALAVLGTGAAYAYRSYFNAPRNGEPPIIKADNSPTKFVPTPADGSGKVPDRLTGSDGAEKMVSREETPVDLNANAAGPRVVFPPLNPNNNPPSAASVSPSTMPAATAPGAAGPNNGTLPSGEPRKVRTFSVRGDQPDGAAMPVNAPPPAAPTPAAKPSRSAAVRTPPGAANANASANTPLSLSPQGGQEAAPDPRTRVASTNPAPASGGGYLVQVSSQRSESDAQASFRALQGKFPSVLGSQSPVIKRADLGEKGIYYRAMVGPFGSSDEASQLCSNLKNAGGQCVVQRN